MEEGLVGRREEDVVLLGEGEPGRVVGREVAGESGGEDRRRSAGLEQVSLSAGKSAVVD